MPLPVHVSQLFERRWSLPVLEQLHASRGSKLVTLCHQLDACQSVVRAALDHLIALGFVQPNPGHGHPLRPEYILAPRGQRLGPHASELNQELAAMKLSELCLRRWSLPVLGTVDELQEARFEQIRERLEVTPRALSQALKGLSTERLIDRYVLEGFPPRPVYRLAPRGEPLALVFERVRTIDWRVGA